MSLPARGLVRRIRACHRVHENCYFILKTISFTFFTLVFFHIFKEKNSHYNRNNAVHWMTNYM